MSRGRKMVSANVGENQRTNPSVLYVGTMPSEDVSVEGLLSSAKSAVTLESPEYDSIGLPVERRSNGDKVVEDAPEVSAMPPATAPAPEPEPEKPPVQGDTSEELPEKFRGKDIKDVVKAYTELERLMGSRSEEVSQMRRFVDELLTKNKAPVAEDPIAARKAEDARAEKIARLLADPEAYEADIEQRVMNKLNERETLNVVAKMKEQHLDTLTNERFVNWLVSNIPQAVAERADRDPVMLNMVLSAYRGSSVGQTTAPQAPVPPAPVTQTPQEAARDAVTKVSQARVAAGVPMASSSPTSPKATFTRRELMDMKLNRPDEYDRRNNEILRAYAEGRVRSD